MMKTKMVSRLIALLLTFMSVHVSATELIYTPVNPSFGGNPYNSSHLFNVANAINDYSGPKVDYGYEPQSALDRLASSLESRLISEFLADAGAGNTGQLETDDFILSAVDIDGALLIRIEDKVTGESSEIQVSGLISN
ncbi:MAG: curli production assembly protein CsgF [Psychromonas sp.]|nr:curli production assembly protein CsgF [Psychromonas sp.]